MGRYALRRVAQLIPVLGVVVIANFVLIQAAPGDVAITMAGERADPVFIEALREKYGLDQPIIDQFRIYVGNLLQGDLGSSYREGRPVIDVLMDRLPATLLLVGTALLIAAITGTIAGTFLGRRVGTKLDSILSVGAIGAYSVPVFWLGLMLILVFAVGLGWFPSSGMTSAIPPATPWGRLLDVLHHLVLPATALATVWFGEYVRLARASVANVLSEEYITAARGTGYSERVLLLRHALRNALLPLVTVFGLQLGTLLAGAVLTETVFAWPGLGRLLFDAVTARDMPLIMGAYLLMSVVVVLATLLTDLMYAKLDPRVAYR